MSAQADIFDGYMAADGSAYICEDVCDISVPFQAIFEWVSLPKRVLSGTY